MGITHRLSEQAVKWGRIWKDRGAEKEGGAELKIKWELAPELTVQELRRASLSFKTGTTKVDGWHPRQFGHLSEPALEGLCFLFRLYEAATVWSSKQSSLLVRLIDKTDGDLRPILWFRSAYRVYCRARSWEVKSWKKKRLKGTLFNNLNGQNIGDEIWRDAVKTPWWGHGSNLFSNSCGTCRRLSTVSTMRSWRQPCGTSVTRCSS